eukprot:6462847-Alexandrium_andersonii.AAC.1
MAAWRGRWMLPRAGRRAASTPALAVRCGAACLIADGHLAGHRRSELPFRIRADAMGDGSAASPAGRVVGSTLGR